MADLTIRFDVCFTPRMFRAGLAGLLTSVLATELSSEQLTLTTYYPAPSGVYTSMLTTGNTYLARDGGNVGVGTGAPSQKLEVTGSAVISGSLGVGSAAAPAVTLDVAQNGAIRVGNAYLSSGGNYMHLANNAWYNGAAWQFAGGAGALLQFSGDTTVFYRHDGASFTELMRIANTGRVGILNATPEAPLDVGGAGVIVARQNNCVPTAYALGTTPCVGANYVTNASGIYVNRIQLGSSGGDSTGTMLCCPLAAGAVTF